MVSDSEPTSAQYPPLIGTRVSGQVPVTSVNSHQSGSIDSSLKTINHPKNYSLVLAIVVATQSMLLVTQLRLTTSHSLKIHVLSVCKRPSIPIVSSVIHAANGAIFDVRD